MKQQLNYLRAIDPRTDVLCKATHTSCPILEPPETELAIDGAEMVLGRTRRPFLIRDPYDARKNLRLKQTAPLAK